MSGKTGELRGTMRARGVLSVSAKIRGTVDGAVSKREEMSGTLRATAALSGGVTAQAALSGTAVIPTMYAADKYDGAYEVMPKFSTDVVLPTRNRLMQQDVTVSKIPQYEISNEAGGKTLIMGDEIYG